MICPKCGKNVSPNTLTCSCGHKFKLGGNTEFFEKADAENMMISSVFSDMFKKHTIKDLHSLLNAGLVKESTNPLDMLRNWQKPWLFVFAFIILIAFIAVSYIAGKYINTYNYLFTAMISVNVIPLTLGVLLYELNIPKNISLYEVLFIIFIGGIFSIACVTLPNVFVTSVHAGSAAFLEEPAKMLVILFFLRKPEKKYILNGLLVGAAVGIGFTFFEATYYAIKVFPDAETTHTAASAFSTFVDIAKDQTIFRNAGEFFSGHFLYSACIGAALAAVKRDKPMSFGAIFNPYTLLWVCIAMLLHYVWNTFSVLYEAVTGGTVTMTVYVFQYIIYSVLGIALVFYHVRKGIKQVTDTVYANRVYSKPSKKAVGHTQAPYNVKTAPSAAPQTEAANITLYGLDGVFRGQKIKIGYGEIIKIGKANTCQVKYGADAPGISREHCSILYNGDIIVTDLSSSYGTFTASGIRLKPYEATKLPDGSAFYLADKVNMFRIGR